VPARTAPRRPLLLFASNFFKHPRMLGSIIPSSPFLINELLSGVDWKRARVVVEYGPGVGTITMEMLKRMRPDAKMVVIEMNADFVRFLREVNDPRLHVVHGSAADVLQVLRGLGEDHADYVVSGIPFSTMPGEVRDAIMKATRDALRPDGNFLVYQFSRAAGPYLRRVFKRVRQGYQPLNILPAHLWFCTP
jgi:phospholipid N-methyltransferase